ncbi:Deoxyribose-phosphate aldolase 1, partial [Haemophilus influenzae]
DSHWCKRWHCNY